MNVKEKEKLNNHLKGWQILSAISSMVFHTVHWPPNIIPKDSWGQTQKVPYCVSALWMVLSQSKIYCKHVLTDSLAIVDRYDRLQTRNTICKTK